MTQTVTQTIPAATLLIGVASNTADPDGAATAVHPDPGGTTYPTGTSYAFNATSGRFGGTGVAVRYELVSITSVSWLFRRVDDDGEAGAGVHVIGPSDSELGASTLSWSASGGAPSHTYTWDQGGGGADRSVRTVGYATRGEVSDGSLAGDGPGLLYADGNQLVGWSADPPIIVGPLALRAFGEVLSVGQDRPFIDAIEVQVTFTRRRLVAGPYLGMRR